MRSCPNKRTVEHRVFDRHVAGVDRFGENLRGFWAVDSDLVIFVEPGFDLYLLGKQIFVERRSKRGNQSCVGFQQRAVAEFENVHVGDDSTILRI